MVYSVTCEVRYRPVETIPRVLREELVLVEESVWLGLVLRRLVKKCAVQFELLLPLREAVEMRRLQFEAHANSHCIVNVCLVEDLFRVSNPFTEVTLIGRTYFSQSFASKVFLAYILLLLN